MNLSKINYRALLERKMVTPDEVKEFKREILRENNELAKHIQNNQNVELARLSLEQNQRILEDLNEFQPELLSEEVAQETSPKQKKTKKKLPAWAIVLIVFGCLQVASSVFVWSTYATSLRSLFEELFAETEEDDTCYHEFVSVEIIEEPTCSYAGKEKYICEKCGEEFEFSIGVIKHSYVDGACEHCGIKEPIQMGTYYWGIGDEGIEDAPIEWDILDIQDGKALLISRYALETNRMGSWLCNSWKNSDLRKWLNDDFYQQVFTEEERAKILSTTIYDVSTDKESQDKLFVLSVEEVEFYYPQWEDRACFCTPLVNESSGVSDGIANWWVRDYDAEGNLFIIVSERGDFYYCLGSDPWHVRPVMWVEWSEK